MRQDGFLDDRYIGRGLSVSYGDGEQLPAHSHSWSQIVYAESGVMQVETAAAAWLVPTTRAIWIPAQEVHWIRMRGNVAMRSFYITGDIGDWPETCQAIEVTPLLRELILHLVGITWLSPEQPEHEHLLHVLAGLIRRSKDVPLVLPMPTDSRARNMAAKILASPGDPGSLKHLAADTGASLRTLQRQFLVETGISLELWRLRARMQQAVVMLSQGSTITDAAFATGYRSSSAFGAAFKRTFGIAPLKYRQSSVEK